MSRQFCVFEGGPLDGEVRPVMDRVQIYHLPAIDGKKPVVYYRGAQARAKFFRDLRKAGWTGSPTP